MSRWPGDSPDLTGLGAVITGASSGIGRHLATALTGYGAQVAALDADTARLAAWADPVDGVQVVGCDVRDEVAVNSAMTGFHGRTGDLSLVVNCAALAEHVNSQDISVERWRETLDVNLTGAFIVARAAARVMRGAGGGSVVLVGSQLGRVTRPASRCWPRCSLSTSPPGVSA
jgi:NAD(P)-dependent dehydrogenase (short-subunit alcohol dehydrogenase family)